MDRLIIEFAQALRHRGLPVSPAEDLDALRALGAVGLAERATVRDALRATMVKRAEDIPTFDLLFDRFFRLRRHAPSVPPGAAPHTHDHGDPPARLELADDLGNARGREDHRHEHGPPTELRRYLDPQRLRSSRDVHDDPQRLQLSLFAQELILNRTPGALESVLRRITHQLRARSARNVFAPGELVPLSDRPELPLDVVASELRELIDHLHELQVDESLIRRLLDPTDDILDGLADLVAAMLDRQRQLAGERGAGEPAQRRSLRRLLPFSAREQRELEAAVRRLGREIQGGRGRRLRDDRTGRISPSRTLRRNLRYEAIPFRPVLRRPRERRPRLVVLCDVSLSTRNLARFWLHLMCQVQRLFSSVRTFVFVADVAEATRLLEEGTPEQAWEAIFGGRLIDVDVGSDFGRVAEQFRAEHMASVTRRSTVLILGDARNNGRPPGSEAVEEIARRARRLIWMTPEPRSGWSLSGCDLPLYEPLCDRVEIVGTVGELADVAGRLTGRARHGEVRRSRGPSL